MRFLEQLQRVQRIDELISQGRTGTAEQLALRLGVAPITVYRYIQQMREMGAPIRYSRRVHSYIYTEDFDLYAVGSQALLPILA